MATKNYERKQGDNDDNESTTVPCHHSEKDKICSVDWSSLTGVIASLSKGQHGSELRTWKFKTVDPSNVFMFEGNATTTKNFNEARLHLGVGPDDSIDTRGLALITKRSFPGEARKLRITKDSKNIIVLIDTKVFIIFGRAVYGSSAEEENEQPEGDGEHTRDFEAEPQPFQLFDDVQQFYLDPNDAQKFFVLRRNNSIYSIDLTSLQAQPITLPAPITPIAKIDEEKDTKTSAPTSTSTSTSGCTIQEPRYTDMTELAPVFVKDNGSHDANSTGAALLKSSGLWNATGGSGSSPAYAVFKFAKNMIVSEFGFKCFGDTTHDVNAFKIQCSEDPDAAEDGWKTVASLNGTAGSKQWQLFEMKSKASARYWRWFIISRHSKWQAWVARAKFIGYEDDGTHMKVSVAAGAGDVERMTAAAFDPVGSILAVGTDDKRIRLVDVSGTMDTQTLDLSAVNCQVCKMRWSMDERASFLIVGDQFGGIRFWRRTAASLPKTTIHSEEIMPRPIKDNGSHQDSTPSCLFTPNGMWNAVGSGGVSWAVFDFDRNVEIHAFEFRCTGDGTHDVNEFSIECSDAADGPWLSVGSFNGESKCRKTQQFAMQVLKSARYWRWFIKSRHSKWQAWVWNAKFKGTIPEETANDTRIVYECFENNTRHYSEITFIECNGRLVLTGSADRTANVWCVGSKEVNTPHFLGKVMLDAVEIYCGALNGRNMRNLSPGSNSILLAGDQGVLFCFSITDVLMNQKRLVLKAKTVQEALAAATPPKIPQISVEQLRTAELREIQSLKQWIGIWKENEFVLSSITTIIRPIFMYLESDKQRYIAALDQFVKTPDFGRLKGVLALLAPMANGPIRQQPTKDLLTLYHVSKEAHQRLQQLLIRMANESYVHATYAGDPGLKKHVRCAQKTVLKIFKAKGAKVMQVFDDEKQEALSYGALCDVARGGIICRNTKHMLHVANLILDAVKKKKIEILRIKNRFSDPRDEGTGYRDIQFNVRFLDPDKTPTVSIAAESGHSNKNGPEALLEEGAHCFWVAQKQDGQEWVVFDFGRDVECCRFDFAHYSADCAVKTFIIEVADDPKGAGGWKAVDDGKVFEASLTEGGWQGFDFATPLSGRYWRWKVMSTQGTAVVWHVNFTYTLKSIANWALFEGVIVELQLHDEKFFQIRKEAMGHKNYTASRFIIDFIDTAVEKKIDEGLEQSSVREDIKTMVQKLLKGTS